MNGNRTPWSTCMSTVPEARTDTAIGTGEFDLDHGITATVLGGRPALAGTSLGAGYLLLRPINLKLVRQSLWLRVPDVFGRRGRARTDPRRSPVCSRPRVRPPHNRYPPSGDPAEDPGPSAFRE